METINTIVLCLLLLLCSCYRDKRHTNANIKLTDIKKQTESDRDSNLNRNICYGINLSEFKCKEPTDTLFANLPYSYSQAIEILTRKINEVNKSKLPINTRQYINAIIIADFVYAAFSYKMDLAILDTAKIKYDTNDLENTYSLGVKNVMTLYCGERSLFYTKLIDKLLNLKSRIIYINKVHTFPLVLIGNKEYIIDPYDPFIVTDKNEYVLDYTNIPLNKVYIHHSSKTFGITHNLISNVSLEKTGKREGFCGVVNYIKLMHPKESLTYVHIAEDFSQVKLVKNNTNFSYAIPKIGRPEKRFFITPDVLLSKYYVNNR